MRLVRWVARDDRERAASEAAPDGGTGEALTLRVERGGVQASAGVRVGSSWTLGGRVACSSMRVESRFMKSSVSWVLSMSCRTCASARSVSSSIRNLLRSSVRGSHEGLQGFESEVDVGLGGIGRDAELVGDLGELHFLDVAEPDALGLLRCAVLEDGAGPVEPVVSAKLQQVVRGWGVQESGVGDLPADQAGAASVEVDARGVHDSPGQGQRVVVGLDLGPLVVDLQCRVEDCFVRVEQVAKVADRDAQELTLVPDEEVTELGVHRLLFRGEFMALVGAAVHSAPLRAGGWDGRGHAVR